jgi:hypothetical protein
MAPTAGAFALFDVEELWILAWAGFLLEHTAGGLLLVNPV